MEADTQAHVAFFLTGTRRSESLDAVEGLGLRPALFAGYRDLTALRYDFPLVLAAGPSDADCVQSLSGIVDAALATAATGSDADRTRKHALRLEQEIRVLVVGAAAGTLAELWDAAATRLLDAPGADPSLTGSLQRVRAAIAVDGPVVDCDEALPARVLTHAWSAVQRQKAAVFRRTLDRLIVQLSDILKADFERSEAGRTAKHLKASVGAGFSDSFDFDAMSHLLGNALPKAPFPESRRTRIQGLLDVLSTQQFFSAPAAPATKTAASPKPYGFLFTSGADALAAFRERMPKLVALARAIAIAELEIDGQYHEAKHDALFAQFGANGLDPQELAHFPDYLVTVNAGTLRTGGYAQLMELLSAGLPIKVLLQIDDILDEWARGEGNISSGMRSRQIANMAIGLNDVYVLQSPSSNLYRFREQLVRGLEYRGPALFCVFSGASARASDLPPYLMSAAAMESRAFPAFTYDPSAGSNWAARLQLDANGQLDLDWPIQEFAYEDERHQRVSERVAFTLVDFVAADRRFAGHLARVPRAKWNGSMIPVDESLTRERKGLPDQVPSVLMVDDDNVLQRVIVDERLVREARRCRDMWHSLQELGGVHNSHAERLLARERATWEARAQQEAETHAASAPTAASAPAPAAVAASPAAHVVAAEPEPERSPDEPYIETARCSTCNECTTLSNKVFAYNDNRQAYIADASAATYALLVEAAESCQVSVIHPGKPRNPNEPGLDELRARAEPFL
ncbi:MAG TPA: ferredoxin [Gemmatimonadaceae bacterium]|nr:ferredoxin [Gemmatimonadaceae bacterium]